MPKVTGPTVPRWQLGETLEQYRKQAGLSFAQVAEELGCSEAKIKKIEAGYGVGKADLIVMLDVFKVPKEDRAPLMDLQKLGAQRGWWSQFGGGLPKLFRDYLGLESSATKLQIFEPLVVHGLFQTEEYARAIAETSTGTVSEEEAARQVQIRMARQERVFDDDQPELWLILDEAVLRRRVGGKEVMRAQLNHLADMSKRHNILVVPFRYGSYTGLRGAFTIFTFDEDVRSPVVYVESQGGNLYMEKAADLHRCNLAFNHLTAAALNPRESAKLIRRVAREISSDEE